METYADVVITDKMDWNLSLGIEEDFPGSERELLEEYYTNASSEDESDEDH